MAMVMANVLDADEAALPPAAALSAAGTFGGRSLRA